MMMDDPTFDSGKALFQRWRNAARPAMPTDTAPDALTLAAYAEGRLSDAEMEQVEAALAADPALLDTLLALRADEAPAVPSAALIRSAQALVPARQDPVVIPFPARRGGPGAASRVNTWLAWAAVAASLTIVSVAGFDLGMRTQHVMSATADAEPSGDLPELPDLTGDDFG